MIYATLQIEIDADIEPTDEAVSEAYDRVKDQLNWLAGVIRKQRLADHGVEITGLSDVWVGDIEIGE
jgi:hypothetical protein